MLRSQKNATLDPKALTMIMFKSVYQYWSSEYRPKLCQQQRLPKSVSKSAPFSSDILKPQVAPEWKLYYTISHHTTWEYTPVYDLKLDIIPWLQVDWILKKKSTKHAQLAAEAVVRMNKLKQGIINSWMIKDLSGNSNPVGGSSLRSLGMSLVQPGGRPARFPQNKYVSHGNSDDPRTIWHTLKPLSGLHCQKPSGKCARFLDGFGILDGKSYLIRQILGKIGWRKSKKHLYSACCHVPWSMWYPVSGRKKKLPDILSNWPWYRVRSLHFSQLMS